MRGSTLAARLRRVSLRLKLLGLAALVIALVVGGTTYLRNRIIEAVVEDEALKAAGATALGVAADLAEREALRSVQELEDLQEEFAQVVPALRALTITRLEGGSSVIVVSTEASPPPEILALAHEATTRHELVVSDELPWPLRYVAVPMDRGRQPYGAVVVTVSMEAVERVSDQMRTTALLVTPVAILVLTGLIDVLARRLVHGPLALVHDTMGRAAAGDHVARARVVRDDEIGRVASGLNSMLDRLGDFNAALRQEVQRATAELREKNRQLMDSAQRLFAARRELVRSEQLAVTGRMAASVAHQIGTPLNLVSGYVQMILADMKEDSVEAARLRTAQEQIAKVTGIVQGLLDQARRPALQRTRVAPLDLISGVCELARPTLEAAGIVLERRAAPDLPAIDADAGQLEQAFLNLITNSIDAMPGGGTLSLSACESDAGVEFEIRDTGSGIPKQVLGRVFDPLFTTKQPGKGTGLGLTIVRDVLAAHGGSVEIASEPGRGTTVRLRVPRADVQRQARA